MACMGPSKDYAFEQGERAYEEVLKLLKENYKAERPDTLGIAKGFEARMQKDWDDQAEQLKLILQELIWTSDAASW